MFINKDLQVGIVSGSNTKQLGLQFLTEKRNEAGDDDGKVLVAWEQRSLSLMQVLRLVIRTLVVKPNSVFLNSAIDWLHREKHVSQEEMELGQDDDNLFLTKTTEIYFSKVSLYKVSYISWGRRDFWGVLFYRILYTTHLRVILA